jgi:hypothetical protein
VKSKITELIKLKNQPVAILKADAAPENTLQFKNGKRGCIIALLSAASKGKVVASGKKTTLCRGGQVGLGFQPFQLGEIEYFLSVGKEGGRSGEYYSEASFAIFNRWPVPPVIREGSRARRHCSPSPWPQSRRCPASGNRRRWKLPVSKRIDGWDKGSHKMGS